MSDDFLGDLHDAMPGGLDPRSSAALTEASAWVGENGVEAVGLGETDEGEACVVVWTSGSADDVPTAVGGLSVRVEPTGPIQAYDAGTEPEG